MRLLLVEDDDRVAAAQELVLRRHGITVARAVTAAQTLDLLRPDPDGFDVVVLDLGLPDTDGIALCRDLRRLTGTPIIISSARGDVGTRLQGLHTGADDYLVKPYDLRELVARVHALVRRRTGAFGIAGGAATAAAPPRDTVCAAVSTRVGVGQVEINTATRRVHVAGTPVPLTGKEFDVLALLARAPGVVFSREQILAEVWGLRQARDDHTLDVHIARIRHKTGAPDVITTVRGVGYRLGSGD